MSIEMLFICGKKGFLLAEKRESLSWLALWWTIILWGLSFIATRVALREVCPFPLSTLPFGIGGFVFLMAERMILIGVHFGIPSF